METKIKICGMKFPENIMEIAAVQPDYLGFIFYDKSPRNFENEIPELKKAIQKVGVFVNATLEYIMEKVHQNNLDLVQLHGEESPELCHLLQQRKLKVIKSFNVDNQFNFNSLSIYYNYCNYFLFDTKGKLYGGNGTAFDWRILERYYLNKPYFLSGGIGQESLSDLKTFFQKDYAKKCLAIDLNSRFEIEPGLKESIALKTFIQNLKQQP
ncbi:phosphoribosylanthranilate isomerase [Flavobacterium sp. 102]|uniref:phosphoribosylanthranilate isomerase n=1 Tax=Flavobacterium sp. 102 TaxID=2135623 RepID=UPI000F21EF65|nr:phosphoribosylanthranilate isomerase [Flavobacterium sp. 102]RKS03254.1 phosphoribosylanthranilate isomerase [Flavobacterium sp. 102]